MKLNASTVIIGNKIILVPYKNFHVPKYHKWMQREDLQKATASEPLSLEEEYVMCRTWFLDDDKCTFIILDKTTMDSTKNETEAMIGDVNLYLSEIDGVKVAECGIMIAEDSARRQGKGCEALLAMLKYGCEILNVEKFEAKIGLSNKTSITLFERIGFQMVHKNDVFSEATFAIVVKEDWKKWLYNITEELSHITYDQYLSR